MQILNNRLKKWTYINLNLYYIFLKTIFLDQQSDSQRRVRFYNYCFYIGKKKVWIRT
jgi:hypothetical protein